MNNQVILLGAYGYTGALVADYLKKMGMKYDIAGRDINKLKELNKRCSMDAPIIVVDLEKPEDFIQRLDKNSIVLNCIGPFEVFSKNFLGKLVTTGCKYLDITGEKHFVASSFGEEFSNKVANENALVVHSCSFESFLSDMLVSFICETNKSYESIQAFYHISPHLISSGTALTMRFAKKYLDKEVNSSSVIEEIPFPNDYRNCVALYTPYPEIVFFDQRFDSKKTGSYVILDEGEAIFIKHSRDAQASQQSVDEILNNHKDRGHNSPTDELRKKQVFQISVVVKDDTGQIHLSRLSGKDPYGLTAYILAWSCKQILNNNVDSGLKGVQTPATVFNAEKFRADSITVEEFSLRY